MVLTLELKQIEVQPGNCLTLNNINWSKFEAILEEMGEDRHSRIAYYQGTLEISMPLPRHEKAKVIIGDLIKILFDELGLEWEPYGSTTFKKREMLAGIEPDDCFYIQNASQMIGMRSLNLSIDPPPDLALEVDVTSKTKISAYTALGVREIWRYENDNLQILVLQEGEYIQVTNSLTFPNFPVRQGILLFLEMSKTQVFSTVRRDFRTWVKEQLSVIS
jgi:Uma2 family endonuclease